MAIEKVSNYIFLFELQRREGKEREKYGGKERKGGRREGERSRERE